MLDVIITMVEASRLLYRRFGHFIIILKKSHYIITEERTNGMAHLVANDIDIKVSGIRNIHDHIFVGRNVQPDVITKLVRASVIGCCDVPTFILNVANVDNRR